MLRPSHGTLCPMSSIDQFIWPRGLRTGVRGVLFRLLETWKVTCHLHDITLMTSRQLYVKPLIRPLPPALTHSRLTYKVFIFGGWTCYLARVEPPADL